MNPVEIQSLVKRYGDFTAVDHVSFSVASGTIFALLGPNGAGKTSTIRVLMGILFPDEGEVRLLGRPPHETREQVGYLPEARGLYRDARLLELLIYLGVLKGLRLADARQRALAWLERFGLAEWAGRKVHELSHGMQQKAQLVAALLHDPPVLVLDEPFQGLDPVNVQLVKELVAELRHQGKTILLSSHQLVHVEALADEVALISRGRIVAQGSLEALRRRYARGDVAVRLANGAPLPEGLPVRRVEQRNGAWYLTPEAGVPPQEILNRLVAQGAPVERFEVVFPSLEEIFLRAVEASESQEEVVA
ncbi:MAG TPA: ATP-binding cassette domain-containing protein [Anaerolineae bacterium]|nr:ATP-binding cassette domain-containing protein [Anaerolineae bacterium]